jgi:hypothetical protein
MSRSPYPYSPPGFYKKFNDAAVEEARATLGDNAFDAHATEGASIAPEQFREAMQREIDELLAATAPAS